MLRRASITSARGTTRALKEGLQEQIHCCRPVAWKIRKLVIATRTH